MIGNACIQYKSEWQWKGVSVGTRESRNKLLEYESWEKLG